MPKKYEVNYTLTFHVEARNEKKAGEIGEEALLDYLQTVGPDGRVPIKSFHREIICFGL